MLSSGIIGTFIGLLPGTGTMLALLLRTFAMVVRIPPAILSVCVIIVSVIVIYAVNTRLFDCGVAAVAGLVGYFLLRAGWPVVALVMGIVIGSIVENHLRQSLSIGQGDLTYNFFRPISLAPRSLSCRQFPEGFGLPANELS